MTKLTQTMGGTFPFLTVAEFTSPPATTEPSIGFVNGLGTGLKGISNAGTETLWESAVEIVLIATFGFVDATNLFGTTNPMAVEVDPTTDIGYEASKTSARVGMTAL